MNERRFAKRLVQELPRWQKEGWVSAEGGPAILADLAAREPAPMWASTLALIGAVLLGLGVITWFAAHWNEIGKLAKLLLVALALTASHLGHGFCLSRGALPKLAQGMALLSVLFFGAAIMLIGQIYNIDAHFPDGIALWAAGGLLTALLFASQPALVASLALAALWTWYEQFDYRGMNWPLLGYLALAAWPLLRHDWRLAARGWGILLISGCSAGTPSRGSTPIPTGKRMHTSACSSCRFSASPAAGRWRRPANIRLRAPCAPISCSLRWSAPSPSPFRALPRTALPAHRQAIRCHG